MKITEEKVISKDKINKSSISLKSTLDDYFSFIVLVVMLVILGLSFVFFLYPKLTQIENFIAETQIKLDDDRSEIEKYKQAIIKYNETYAKISEDEKDKINSMIAPKQEFISIYNTDLIISISELLSREGFLLTDISVANVEAKASTKKKSAAKADESGIPDGVDIVKVDIAVEGLPYDRFKYLLKLLESKLRIADVQNVSYSSVDEDLSLEFNTYIFAN